MSNCARAGVTGSGRCEPSSAEAAKCPHDSRAARSGEVEDRDVPIAKSMAHLLLVAVTSHHHGDHRLNSEMHSTVPSPHTCFVCPNPRSEIVVEAIGLSHGSESENGLHRIGARWWSCGLREYYKRARLWLTCFAIGEAHEICFEMV